MSHFSLKGAFCVRRFLFISVFSNSSSPLEYTKLAIACFKLTIETLEQGVKYVQSEQQRHQNDWLYCQLWTYFTPYSKNSIVNFEQVNAGWENIGTNMVQAENLHHKCNIIWRHPFIPIVSMHSSRRTFTINVLMKKLNIWLLLVPFSAFSKYRFFRGK